MTNEDRAEKVLPIILETIRDDSDEEKRILGLELVDKLAEYLGRDNCQNFLMYEIVSLQDDPIYRVRKETVMRIVNISKVLGKEIFLRILFPVFKKLSTDQIWGVRRSAVEVLPQISNLCPIEIKNGILIEMFKKFSTDSSKWVKLACFQYLGPFIASYEGIDPSPVLVDFYAGVCQQAKAHDSEVAYHCAFNFPAVLFTLGAQGWPKLTAAH
jgi:serine/threonine-protein phosphatase 4 regulatory subunit 1